MLKGRRLFFVVLVCAALNSATASADAPRKNFANVVAQIYSDESFVVSPTSLNIVLHIAKDASRGKTADEIVPLLFDDNLDEQFPRPGTDASILSASGVWISSQSPGNAEFNALFVRKYGGSVTRVSFRNGEGQNAVGKWIAKLSNGDLHGLPLDGLTEFVIANIQIFKAAWVHPFNPVDTKRNTFNGRHGKEAVQMMSRWGMLPYHEDSYGQTAALDYAGPYQLVLFLPRRSTERPLESAVKHGFNVPLESAQVYLSLPKLHVKSARVLTEPLRQVGMATAFGPDANFSPMLGTKGQGEAVMFQDIDLKIDERGTIAQALTQFQAKVQRLVRFPTAIRFDRPFAFEIVRTGDHPVTLFEGQILNVPQAP